MKGASVNNMCKQIVPFETSNPHIHSSFFTETVSLDIDNIKEEILIFWEPITGRYFKSTLSRVLQAEYHFNRNYVLGALISLNEYLEFLGIGKVSYGEDIGWWNCSESCEGIGWIDFNHIPATKGDQQYYIIDILVSPEHF